VAAGEGVTTGKYEGLRVGYAAGPFDVAGAYAQTGSPSGFPDAKNFSIGGSWDFKMAKIMGYYGETKLGNGNDKSYSVSGIVPIGAGEVHVSYSQGRESCGSDTSRLGICVGLNGSSTTASQFALGYVYNLSKRTALYATGSWLGNNGNGRNAITAVGPQTSGAALPTPGGNSEGAEFGIRHFF